MTKQTTQITGHKEQNLHSPQIKDLIHIVQSQN